MMEQRWVKKEEVEKQLNDIFQLMQEIDRKMDDIINSTIVEYCEQKEEQINQLTKQLEKMENHLDDGTMKQVDVFQKTIPMSAFS
jgi:F0F1-type ATP synthase membrane subunit b/b'